jgi:hypothetical protein
VQLAGHQQPYQMLGISTIGLDPIPRGPGDLARRRDNALDPAFGELARQP